MKKILTSLYLFLTLVCNSTGYAQITAFNLTGISSPATTPPTTTDPNLTASDLTRGAGAAANSASNSFRTTGFQNNGIAITNTDYFQITLKANTGYKLNLSSIDAKLAGTANFTVSPGVTSQFAYSIDGSTFTLIGTAQTNIGTPQTLTQINLAGIPALQSVPSTTTVTLRYYASGQTTTGGWGFNSPTSTDNALAIGGSVVTTVLSVELLSLKAKATQTQSHVTWQTATEQNNSHFNVERSQDGFAFDKIGEVKGAGTSTKAKDYNFVDNAPVKGTNYYQLRQVDFDGKETISKTVAVNFDGKVGKAKVYPTVVKVMLTVELASDATSDISVRDVTGRVILSKNTEGVFSTTLDLGAAANGLYFITVQSNQGLETMKVLKQ